MVEKKNNYSEVCLNPTLNKPNFKCNVIMQEIFVNLTCINQTPVYSEFKVDPNEVRFRQVSLYTNEVQFRQVSLYTNEVRFRQVSLYTNEVRFRQVSLYTNEVRFRQVLLYSYIVTTTCSPQVR
jgi:hypothetical protein